MSVTTALLLLAAVTAVVTGLVQLIKSLREGKKEKSEGVAVELKTPAEIESIAVSTMRTSLESSQSQVKTLNQEAADRDARHAAEKAEWAAEKAGLRDEVAQLEQKLRNLLAEFTDMKRRHNLAEPAK